MHRRTLARRYYLRDVVREGGGSIFRVGLSEGARTSALATSPTRRKLYEEQKYVPTDFMAVWDRSSLLRWASKSKAEGSLTRRHPAPGTI
jgi:hypothetical protein